MRSTIRTALVFAVLASTTAFAANDPTLEPTGQGLECKVGYHWVRDPIGTGMRMEPYLTAGAAYSYFNPAVAMKDDALLVAVKAKFFYCQYGSGSEAVWVERNHLSWQHFVMSSNESFTKGTVVASEYTRGSDTSAGLEFAGSAAIKLDAVLSPAEMDLYKSGKAAQGLVFLSVGSGAWNTPGGVYVLRFAVTAGEGASVEGLDFLHL